ncbi:LytR/AlgR family response regulator transcription factor [Mangrovibacterium diazotrophicum]|uniref:LytTR family two component transcriptional regulator n=1 Tax=Mangrovibacterium diazotrophicum TaxID=1261403 RepID=A0A419W937_9BACT|nr:LytTR family DNA-binding domain-containing protein [Mangrovibacterium diazotrophicum]RKD91950.1 LytTR family two component transcriptional regulator [Mangrovibacterium diazotrophicum]
MKVVIVEDEEPAVIRLKKLISEVDDRIEVIACLESVSQAAEWFVVNSSPDLIFMDIRLADGLSFEIFELVKVEAPVIFTTAYNEYAMKAFKVNSVDYLLKPISRDDLGAALEKFRSLYQNSQSDLKGFQTKLNQLLAQFNQTYKSRFFVKVGQRYKSVSVDEVACFFVEEKSTFILDREEKMLAIDSSLDQLGKQLDPQRFFRVNRNFLVNLNFVSDVIIYSGSRLKVKLKNGHQPGDILVSREKVNAFKEWMDR